MDYQALQAELERYFAELQALGELPELELPIRECLDNAASYLEGALEIAREKNPNSFEYLQAQFPSVPIPQEEEEKPYPEYGSPEEDPDYDPDVWELTYGGG